MKATLSRRILAVLLTLAMALTLIPAAFASNFSDVPDDAWYAKAVDFCFDNNLMKGTGEGFAPNGTVTREMAVQTLYAMAGSPATEYEAKFTDVPDGAWYTPAIMWGASCGVVNGYDTGAFGVGDKVTREQMAMFFYNFATLINMPEDFASLNKFPDNADTSSWAKTAVQWAVAMGILSGKAQLDGPTLLKPKDPLTRAELASILSRFYPQAEEYIVDICYHENTEIRDAKAATCEEPGYTGDTYCVDCGEKIATGEEIPALGHNYVDGICENCGKPDPDAERTFALTQSLSAGMQVIIYNPGHEMVIKNENDNNWYLVPEAMTPTDGKFIETEPGELNDYVWTVVANEDGSLSFVNGDNMIVAWVSGTYIELTNDPNYDGADGRWNVTWTDGLAYIGHATFSNSYGPAYIECYYNANKDKTNISGYTSSNPSAKSTDFGFEFYAIGGCSNHNWVKGTTVAPTCLDEGYTTYTCSKCGTSEKRDIVAALGHIDENKDSVCDRCGAPMGDFTKVTDGVIANGMEIVIYNPGHGMAVSNETDNNWYLVPVAITPDGDIIKAPDASLIWTVIDNGDGTYSFKSGDYMIGAWVSGTYIELTNDPNYSGVDTKWVVTCTDGLFYLQSSSLSNSYGPAYIECYYNANKDKTNISGYTSGDPTAKSADFGFEIYARGGEGPCDHNWVKGAVTAPTCLEEGYTTYTCSKCNAAKKGDIVPATGHIDENADSKCDVCGADLNNSFVLASEIKDGDQVVIYNPGNGKAVPAVIKSSYYLDVVDITPNGDRIETEDATIIWTVSKDGDNYSFVNEAGTLSLNFNASTSKTSITLDGENPAMTVVPCNADNYTFFIYSATQTGTYGPVYLEYYAQFADFSAYSTSADRATEQNFGYQFYVKGGEPIKPCEHDWVAGTPVAATCLDDGYTPYTCSKCNAVKTGDVVPATGHDFGDDNICDLCGYEKPDLGDSVAIFFPGENKVMTTESYFYNNKKYELVAADATLSDNIISTDAENVALFTPVEDGEFTSFVTADGKYLSADGTNVQLVDAESDNTKFVVEEAEGGVYLRCATAQYSGKPQYIEFYSGYFTVFSFNASNAGIYTFVLAPVAARCEHEWDDGEETTEATCTAAGVITYTCGLCGATKTESIEALGHDFGDDNECDRCGYTKPTGDGFVKVTDASDLGDGLYLIVYETDSVAMNGGLAKVDAGNNVISVEITDGVIAADDATMAAAFEIKAMDGGYSILAGNGKYLSGSASANTIKEGTSAVANTITIDGDGNATIFAGGYLMFNSASGDTNYRFRYYKTQTQKPIQLYKLAD